jgi:hypothetical protein
MRGNRGILAGGAAVAVVVLIGATAMLRPAAATPTMTVYKTPT